MQLLLFAHKNEAAAFFHFHQFQLMTDTHDLYHDGHYYLLITGEGLWDSLIKLSLALHSLAKQNISITHMVNLGVAGSLRKDLKRFDLCQVRTSYAALTAHHPEFHSHTASPTSLSNELPFFDCLSTHQRLLSVQDKLPLMPFAHIVDRELWSLAKLAMSHNIPWNSLKIISDEWEEKNMCNLVQEQAHNFSLKLYEVWNTLQSQERSSQQPLPSAIELLFKTLATKNIYLTFSQRHQVEDFIKRILAQENISLDSLMAEIPFQLWTSKRTKDNAQHFIHWLKLRLTPQQAHLATPVSHWLKIWKNSHLHFQMDTIENFEALEVKFKSYNVKDWKLIMEHLNNIPREELENILTSKTNL